MPAPAMLPDPRFLDEPRLRRLLSLLNPADGEGETRVIGGAVRNALLGEPVSEVDCATTLLPTRVTALCEAASFQVVPTGIRFGTVTVVIDADPFEVTTLRRDVTTDGRWAEVAFGTDWTADAERRDFTMNALSCDGEGRLFDPLHGYDDLMARRVRFIGDARRRIREDYLRALRFFRFHAAYGEGPLDPEGVDAVIAERDGVPRLSPERLRQEFSKLLCARRAVPALQALAETGLIATLLGVTMPARLARLAAIEVALRIPASPSRRLGALAVFCREDADRLGARLRLSWREHQMLEGIGRWSRALADAPDRAHGRRVLHAAGSMFIDVVLAAWAEAAADPDDPRFTALLALPETAPVPPFPLRGADLIGLGVPKGPEVGRLLAEAERAWIASDFMAARDALLTAIWP